MSIRKAVFAAASLAIIGAVILVIERLRLPQDTLLWEELQNAGHTPAFGLIAYAVLAISRSTLTRWERNPIRQYAASAFVTLALGAVLEISQIAGPRDADVWDFVRNVAGVISFLGIYLPFDKVSLVNSQLLFRLRYVVFLCAALVLLGSAVPLGLLSAAYVHREDLFPSILRFESALETRFVSTRGSDLERTDSPKDWPGNSSSVGRVTFGANEYPSIVIDEPHPDWRQHEKFCFEVYSALDTVCFLALRIEDRAHNQEYEDRFNASLRIVPGLNKIAVPLTEVEHGPASRLLNMSSVGAVQLFMAGLKSETVLYFDNFRLE
jgi:hypothetical protein